MKIAVAMSGGVDSSAAAAILMEQGHELVGFTMQLWDQRRGINVDENGDPLPSRCCSLDDVYDARRVAEELGFPFYVLNLERDFERDVVAPFVTSYLGGETPIPCVGCNSRLKFASLDRLAASLGCEKVATGHYARVEYDPASDRYRLLRGQHHEKDQSYFLWELTQAQLSRALFPLGEMSKPQAREAARDHHLVGVAEKTESQEICFVPDGDYARILEQRLPADAPALSRGPILTSAGSVVGEHTGFARYTIGQRRGVPGGFPAPMYVIAIRPEQRAVVIGTRDELLGHGLIAREVNWLAETPTVGAHVSVRVRHRAPLARAEIVRIDDGEIEIALDEPVAAITPGQSVVFYDRDRVLGGGLIETARQQRNQLPVLAA
jgi:tRNA-uridine 2-sulfurtransferase